MDQLGIEHHPTTAVPAAIENAWQVAIHQINCGSVKVALPLPVAQEIGHYGISIIAKRFAEFMNAHVSTVIDSSRGEVHLMPFLESPSTVSSPTLSEKAAKNARSKVAKSRMEKIPRPPNSFILYRQFYHPITKANNPDKTNCEISKIIGLKWRNEQKVVKEAYRKMASERKRLHLLKHPSYQYQPRKSAEKQRRKATANEAQNSTSQEISKVMNAMSLDTVDPVAAIKQVPVPDPLPQFEQNCIGEPTFTLGAGTEQLFCAMLEEYNQSNGLVNLRSIPGTRHLHEFTIGRSPEVERELFSLGSLVDYNEYGLFDQKNQEIQEKHPEVFASHQYAYSAKERADDLEQDYGNPNNTVIPPYTEDLGEYDFPPVLFEPMDQEADNLNRNQFPMSQWLDDSIFDL